MKHFFRSCRLLLVPVLLCAPAAAASRPFSFARDIGGILTRQGCNDSRCHGGVKGRGGLRLSPESRDPSQDYRGIVEGGQYQVLTEAAKEPRIPRVNVKNPEQSLLLAKPTMTVPHGGGRRFAAGSADYLALLEWIRKGAPYGAGDPSPARLEVQPAGELYLNPSESRQLRVLAHFPDRQTEDVSREVRFETGNAEIATVSGGGIVTAGERGETPIVVRGLGLTAHVLAAVVHSSNGVVVIPAPANYIDEHVFEKLRKLRVQPSAASTDEEFLRRVCLDLTGKLPPPDRVLKFLADRDPRKRDKLIDILLDSPQWVDLWTFRFADLFRVNAYANQNRHWDWVRDRIARNTPYDRIARERIAAQGSDGPVAHFSLGKPTPLEQVVAEETRVFLGRRIDCAQCHNHPYDRWTQNQFWGMAAFFSKMTFINWVADDVLYDDPDGQEVDRDLGNAGKLAFIKAIHPRTKKEMPPTFFDGAPLPVEKRSDPRLALAEWMTAQPEFSEAAVNRIWRYFFGRGIVEPADDIRDTNPPTHGPLLAALAADFRTHGYDLKHLMRRIVQSQAYQRSGSPLPGNRDDDRNYSWSRPRLLEAEIQLDAISSATGSVQTANGKNAPLAAPETGRAVQLQYPASLGSRFLQVNDCPLRNNVPERDVQPKLAQALHLLAGSTFNDSTGAAGGRLDKLLERQAADDEVVDELYLATVTRRPSEEERTAVRRLLAGRKERRRETFEDLLWALLGAREFVYNH